MPNVVVQSGDEITTAVSEAIPCTWREKRWTDWSETLYSGFITELCGTSVLVSKLSHGLRVIRFSSWNDFKFETLGKSVQMSDTFVFLASSAFEADQKLQTCFGEYREITSELT